MNLTGIFVGVLGLAGLEVFVSSSRAVAATGSIGTAIAGGVERFMSPDKGLIPNYHDSGASTSTGPTAAEQTQGAQGTATLALPKSLRKTATSVPAGKGQKPIVAVGPGPANSNKTLGDLLTGRGK